MIDEPGPTRQTVLDANAGSQNPASRFAGNGRGLMIGVLVALALVLTASVVTIGFAVRAGIHAARQRLSARRVEDQARRRNDVETAVRGDRERATRPHGSFDPADWITSDDYPAAALRAYQEGVVTITWVVNPDGSVDDCKTLHASGHASLDQAACSAIMRRARYPAVPSTAPPRIVTRRVVWRIPH